MAYLDFENKQVGTGKLFYPGEDIDADFAQIRQFYAGRQGKNPENASPIQLRKNEP